MYTSVRGQAHEVYILAILLSIAKSRYYLRTLHDAIALTSTINLYPLLLNHASVTDLQVPHSRLHHRATWQLYVSTALSSF